MIMKQYMKKTAVVIRPFQKRGDRGGYFLFFFPLKSMKKKGLTKKFEADNTGSTFRSWSNAYIKIPRQVLKAMFSLISGVRPRPRPLPTREGIKSKRVFLPLSCGEGAGGRGQPPYEGRLLKEKRVGDMSAIFKLQGGYVVLKEQAINAN
jgi:hypothetical protein